MTQRVDNPITQSSPKQVEFLQYIHQDLQAIIRLLDAKAGLFISLLVFLITGGLPLVKDTCARLMWTGPTKVASWIYVLSFIAMIGAFVASAFAVHHVIRPRGINSPSRQHGVMFYADILKHLDSERYHERAKEMSDDLLVKNLTTGIFSLSTIVEEKTVALRFAKWPTLMTFALWGINSVVAVRLLLKG